MEDGILDDNNNNNNITTKHYVAATELRWQLGSMLPLLQYQEVDYSSSTRRRSADTSLCQIVSSRII